MLVSIFFTFFKIGMFTFGGGYAMIPLIEKEVVENHEWISEEDLMDVIAIAESTPGPIAINAATFVGYKTKGFFGAFVATLGVVIPSLIIIMSISYILEKVESMHIIKDAFEGIRIAVIALMVKAVSNMFNKSPKQKITILLMCISFCLSLFFKFNAIYIILICVLLSFVYESVGQKA